MRSILLASVFICAAHVASAATIVALREDGKLVKIDTETRKASAPMTVKGADGLLSVALRPADGKLYGLTAASDIVRIDTATGVATKVSSLDKKLMTGPRAAISFNPVVDRLRVVGPAGNNYRINVDTGMVTVDGTLKYGAGELSGTTPTITGAAYTNSFAGTKETALYTIDTTLGQMNVQAPPNDGMQMMKGELGMKPPHGVGFVVLSDGAGANIAYLVAGGMLAKVDTATGKAMPIGPITGLAGDVLGAAIMK